ncbi:HicB-like protein involved in pilus formation [Brevibacterium sanguinis]|uniref:HicB-like protein involved in pilus formation n=2 Tax=Brevibacterium TaxID=1696 RepID=A0A366IEZ6_9MICO|nr:MULTISPECIES: toxin-antitoxin system HicB family antitoxin [Brevibacterium]RBP62901.1 HicB-like protein involved in pilus formation [Brevibacterium sanguinis]RBP69554.1 HicB-like protein involved in pilus formation [Brevibacterium celere]
MNITHHVEQLQNQLTATAAAGDEATREVADRLVTALEPAARVVILDVLAESSAELTTAIAPASIDVRLRGRDIDFVVDGLPVGDASSRSADAGPDGHGGGSGAGDETDRGASPVPIGMDDDSTSRTTLRLPDSIKAQAERAAKAEGISLNAWLVRAIAAGLEPRSKSRQRSNTISGWMR